MTRKTVVFGSTSFLCKVWRENDEEITGRGVEFLKHTEIDDYRFGDDGGLVINFAFAPILRRESYREEADLDLKIARIIQPLTGWHYLMLSTRAVYDGAIHDRGLREDDSSEGSNTYGKNKSKIEQKVVEVLGEGRVTILRLSNIFGFEVGGRRTFTGAVLKGLRDDNIIKLDISRETGKDFLAARNLGNLLSKWTSRAEHPPCGVFNVGSGFPTAVGDFCDWIVEGYGKGEVHVVDSGGKMTAAPGTDVFWMNIEKLQAAEKGDFKVTAEDIKGECLAIGKLLKKLSDQPHAVCK